jgi:hypothetical protein
MGRKKKNNQSEHSVGTPYIKSELSVNEPQEEIGAFEVGVTESVEVTASEVTDLEVSADTVEEVIERVQFTEIIEGENGGIKIVDSVIREPKEKSSNRYYEMLKERAEQRIKWKSQN